MLANVDVVDLHRLCWGCSASLSGERSMPHPDHQPRDHHCARVVSAKGEIGQIAEPLHEPSQWLEQAGGEILFRSSIS
jgi:hypothetical protein